MHANKKKRNLIGINYLNSSLSGYMVGSVQVNLNITKYGNRDVDEVSVDPCIFVD